MVSRYVLVCHGCVEMWDHCNADLPALSLSLSLSLQHDLYQYTYVWEGSRAFVSAFFASTIRDNVIPNEQEDFKELGIGTDLIRGDSVPFGLVSTKDPQQARVVVYDFDDSLYTTDLKALALLAVDNNPLRDIIAGVVHPRGYTVNEIFGQQTGFELQQENDQTFIVRFTDVSKDIKSRFPVAETQPTANTTLPTAFPSNAPSEAPSPVPSSAPSSKEGEKTPTFPVFPLWFSDNALPRHAGEIAVATKEKCSVDSCTVSVGTSLRSSEELGFAFFALKQSVKNTPGIVHGTVDLYFDLTNKTWKARKLAGDGFTITTRSGYDCPKNLSPAQRRLKDKSAKSTKGTTTINEDAFNRVIYPNQEDGITEDNVDVTCNFPTANDENLNNYTVSRGAVEIEFDEIFSSMPTVVVSPILNNPDHDAGPISNTMDYDRFESKADAFSLPSAIVESVSTRKTVIKAGWVNERESCTQEFFDSLELRRCLNRNQDDDVCDGEKQLLDDLLPNVTDAVRNEIQGNLTLCLENAALDAEGDKATTFEPLSFSFIAVGPPL